jgi:hypothetical protein
MSQMLNLEGSGMLPPDDILVADVQQSESLPLVLFLVIVLTDSSAFSVLANSNLQSLTKKGVREELERMYGVGLGDRKMLVNRTIEMALGL